MILRRKWSLTIKGLRNRSMILFFLDSPPTEDLLVDLLKDLCTVVSLIQIKVKRLNFSLDLDFKSIIIHDTTG